MNPSSSFQRGDRVKATNTLFKMNGTVERLQAFTGLVRVRWDSRPGLFGSTVAAFSEWVHPSHLALLSREVSQATFSKGDVVQILTDHPTPEYRGALGVVVEVTLDADRRGTQYRVRPYAPSKPLHSLSRGPFTYWGRELMARRAVGLVPVNFVREALGLKPAEPPKPRWTPVGYTDEAGFLFATGGTLPPKVADIVDVKATPRGLEATFQVSDEIQHFLSTLERPTSIRISEAMRRRGITSQDAVKGLVERAELAEHESSRQRFRSDRLKEDLAGVRADRNLAESRTRDLADERDRLRDQLDTLRRQLEGRRLAYQELSDAASTIGVHKLRRELGEHRTATAHARAELEDAIRDLKLMERRAFDAERERTNAHVSRQKAENEAATLKAERDQLKRELKALNGILDMTADEEAASARAETRRERGRADRLAQVVKRVQEDVRGF